MHSNWNNCIITIIYQTIIAPPKSVVISSLVWTQSMELWIVYEWSSISPKASGSFADSNAYWQCTINVKIHTNTKCIYFWELEWLRIALVAGLDLRVANATGRRYLDEPAHCIYIYWFNISPSHPKQLEA